MISSAELLGSNGPFLKQYEGFSVRECQTEMAESIEFAIDRSQTLIAESGTGTGKTFAYLVPALTTAKKTVISTRTLNLQEQLFDHDIPAVCRILNLDLDVKLLKGRSNYICLLRYEEAKKQPNLLESKSALDMVSDYLDDGDISRCPSLDATTRAKITSTASNCFGNQCDFWRDCYVFGARNNARKADVIVINHNLLCLYLLRELEDESDLLSGADVIVVDEAHRFPEIAAETMGISISTQRIEELCRNFSESVSDSSMDLIRANSIRHAVTDAVEKLRKVVDGDQKSLSLAVLSENRKFMSACRRLFKAVEDLAIESEQYVETVKSLGKCQEQAAQIMEDMNILMGRLDDASASWYEANKESFKISKVPLDPGKEFGKRLSDSEASWIFTSATLAVGKEFSHFQYQMGLEYATTVLWDSPFQFDRQALIYLPPDMPQPNTPMFDERIADLVKQVAPVSRGRTFVLFTSYKSMQSVYDMIEDELDYTLLMQGQTSRTRLLNRFKRDGNAVLLGTSSFWEGVDVKGEALSCVIIAKLPFVPPDDPVLKARSEYMASSGQNPFNEWQVPVAALTLKQGAGRLLRDVNDKGVLILCDPRITTKNYGVRFLDSLPPIPRTTEFERVKSFFAG